MKQGLLLLGILMGMGIVPARSAPQQPAQMKTLTYHGVLVDTSCMSPTEGAAPPSTANRTVGECPVTASTANLGIKLDDGRVVRFDLVGTKRTQDEMKTNKRWSKDLQEGKPIHATVDGVMSNGKLVVTQIR